MKFTKTPDVFMKVGVYDQEFIGETQIGVTTVNLKKFVNNPGLEQTGSTAAMQKPLKSSIRERRQAT